MFQTLPRGSGGDDSTEALRSELFLRLDGRHHGHFGESGNHARDRSEATTCTNSEDDVLPYALLCPLDRDLRKVETRSEPRVVKGVTGREPKRQVSPWETLFSLLMTITSFGYTAVE